MDNTFILHGVISLYAYEFKYLNVCLFEEVIYAPVNGEYET